MGAEPQTSSQSVFKPLAVLAWLAAAIGFPVSISDSLIAWANEHPLLATVAGVAYLAVMIIAPIVAKLHGWLTEYSVNQIKDWVTREFSGYRKYYLKHAIYYRHRNFDVKGLTTQGTYTLELDQVFVDLSVQPIPPHEASSNPIQKLPEDLQTGRHSIWQYLKAGPEEVPHLAILGAPGSGKTTLLKHVALTLGIGKKRRWDVPRLLPILLFLRNHAEAIGKESGLSLVQVIQSSLANLNRMPPAGWFEHELLTGRCLILLDGLDEVADPEARKKVVAWVEGQMTAHANNRFVVTSRPFGYRDNPLAGVNVLDVRPFTSEQVKRFVHNWYVANEIRSQVRDDPGVREDAREGAEDLLDRLWGTPALSELAVNPLLLTMIATVHKFRSSLPGRRVELYAEICEVFLGKRQEARGQKLDLAPAQKQRVLEPLAYHMMCQKIREIAAGDAAEAIAPTLRSVSPGVDTRAFLEDVENTSGLVIEREGGIYSFSHLTFQEYLASSHVGSQNLEANLADRVGDSWWHETIRLYAAQADASAIIAACLEGDPTSVEALVLAIECQEGAREVAPELRAKLEWHLEEGLEGDDLEERRLVAETLLTRRLRTLERLDDERYIDGSLVTHAEYQVFIDEKRVEGAYHQPDHWAAETRFPAREAKTPLVGVRFSDAEAFSIRTFPKILRGSRG